MSIANLGTISLQFHRHFSYLFKSWYFSISSFFFMTYSMVKWASDIYYCAVPFFLVCSYDVWSVVLNFVVSLNRKIP